MKDSKPKISFCVLFYNQEKFVEETLDSMFNQDYENYEIIIRDDCSSDNSADVVKKYLLSKNSSITVKVDYGTENLGIVKSLNRVLELSEGEYIALQGGDDISLPERLSESINLILGNNAQLIGADAKVVNENKQIIYDSFYINSGEKPDIQYKEEIENGIKVKVADGAYLKNVNVKYVARDCLGGFGILFDRRILNHYRGIFPESIQYEDRLLTFLAAMGSGCIQYNKQLVLYRRTSNNVSMPLARDNNSIINNTVRLITMENNVCLEQINYLENNGAVNANYNREDIINAIKGEYYVNLMLIKSVKKDKIKERKIDILNELFKNPCVSIKQKGFNFVACFFPYIYRIKVIRDYHKRLKHFGN